MVPENGLDISQHELTSLGIENWYASQKDHSSAHSNNHASYHSSYRSGNRSGHYSSRLINFTNELNEILGQENEQTINSKYKFYINIISKLLCNFVFIINFLFYLYLK